MNTIQLFIATLFSFLFPFYVTAQELSIGDQLPDYTFGHVLRYTEPAVSLADFKGKVLILDFWRTTCGGCILAMPHLDSLQKEFGDKLAVMPLTTEGEDTIQRFFSKNYIAKRIHLPTITEDTLLAGKAIKFVYIPHTVIADGTGKIVAITEPKYITRDVITKLVAGQEVNLPLKMELTDFNYSTPVFWEGKERNAKYVQYTSAITGRIPGALEYMESDTINDSQIFYRAYNKTILQLYAQALHFDFNPNRIVLEVADSSRFEQPAGMSEADWNAHNLWAYNLLIPISGANPYQYAVQDFDRFFRTTGRMETRRMKCLLLVKNSKRDEWKTKGGEPTFESRDSTIIIKNVMMWNVHYAWNTISKLPILNETGLLEERADFMLTASPNDLTLFRKQLNRYGLDLVPAERDIEVMVIDDRKEAR